MEILKKYAVHLKSLAPLVMHADTLCNPLHPLSKKMKEQTKIRKKQDENYLAMAQLEWLGAMYFHNDVGLHIPSYVVQASFRYAARKFRQGKHTKAIMIDSVPGPLLIGYEHIKDPQQLWDVKNSNDEQIHVHAFSVVVGAGARIIRTLPIFPKWELKFDLFLSVELLSEEDLVAIINTAGLEFGLCELRPGLAVGNFGRFRLESFDRI